MKTVEKLDESGESQAQNVRDLIVVAVVAAVFSSFTLWLIDSWIKYPLFLLEMLTIIVLYLILTNYPAKLPMAHIRTGSVNGGLIIDTCFMVSASSLLVINVVGLQAGLPQLVLTLLCGSFLSGYALLNILGISSFFSRLESVVISYIASFATSGILFLFLLPFNQLTRPVIVCVLFLVLGVFSMVKHLKQPRRTLRKSLSRSIDALPLAITVLFYIIAFFLMYPNYAVLAGTDMPAGLVESIVLNRTPNLYFSFNYFFYNLFEACLYSLSTPSSAAFLSSLQILNWISPLVFYVMAKEHLESIDKRLPSIATVFWVLFSNLGWLYFVNLKLTSNVQSQLQLISMTADKTIFGPILASFALEYTPIVVSFTMLLVLIYFLKRFDIPTKKYIALFSIITAAMYLTHVVEAAVFALFLAVYGIMSKSESLRINDSLNASLLGFLTVGAVYVVLPMFTYEFTWSLSAMLSIITPILSLSFSLCLRRLRMHIPRLRMKQQFKIPWVKAAIICLSFLYAVAFLTWTSSADTFTMSPSGSVPIYFYPLMLGVTGLLSLLALTQITGDKSSSKLVFFVVLIFFAFVAGRTISFINTYFFDTGYWEYRLLTFAVIGTSILAPIAIVKFASSWRTSIRSPFKALGICLLISVITLAGVSSSFLGLEYWHTVSNEPGLIPSNEEFAALNRLKTIFDTDPYSWLVTVTGESYATSQFSASPDWLSESLKPVLYTAENPEVPLYVLCSGPYLSHPYLYMDSRDEVFLQENYEDGYVAQHLIPMLPSVFQNQEVTVYNMSQVAPPTTTSDTALVVPFDESAFNGKPYLYAYDVLSQGLYNYTVAYDLDDKLMQKSTLVLSFDPPTQNIVVSSFNEDFNRPQNGWTLDSGSWSGEQSQLLGGQLGQYAFGNILSPVSAENFTATFNVTPLEVDPNTVNFARLLYSWKDAENYRSANLLFWTDGLIYVSFSDVTNGTFTEYPSGLGINTGIEWAFNEEHEVKVSVDDNTSNIYVDNTLFCTANMKNVKGTVGLSYVGNCSIAFSQFQLEGTSNVALRNFNDYMNYVQSGGTLIVLNTNGYGGFAESLLSPSNGTLEAEAIKTSNETLQLPANVETPILSLKSDDTEILSNYTSALGENTVYTVRESLGNGQLFYVNLYPLINHLELEGDQPSFYNMFGKLLAVAGLDLGKCKLSALPASVSTFEEAELSGTVEVESNSILFPLQVNIPTVEVTANGENSTFNNVTSLSLGNYEKITAKTGTVSIGQGKGFYAGLTLNETTQLTPAGNDTILTLWANDEEFELSNLTEISLVPENPLEIYACTPSIKSSGNASLTDVTISGSLNGRQISGQDLKISGILTFDTYLSDSYTLAENIKVDGSLNTNPQIITYDEWSVLPTAAIWSLILLPIFIGTTIILYYVKRVRARRKLRNASNT